MREYASRISDVCCVVFLNRLCVCVHLVLLRWRGSELSMVRYMYALVMTGSTQSYSESLSLSLSSGTSSM
jgi:hypothetical protein